MRRAAAILLALCFLLVGSNFLVEYASKVELQNNTPDETATRATITVPGDYTLIQNAIDAASNGDTINVAAGTYRDELVIPAGKSLTLKGAGYTTTTIDGHWVGSAITVYANSCVIDGFTIQGSGMSPGDAGIFLDSDHNTIKNCRIRGCYQGIYLSRSDGNTIDNNIIEMNLGPEPLDLEMPVLKGHWKFEETSYSGSAGEVKDSVGSANGTGFGGVVPTTGGIVGRCAYFDGNNDHIVIPINNGTNVANNPLSYTFWAKNTNPFTTAICLNHGDYDKGQFRAYAGVHSSNAWRIGMQESNLMTGQDEELMINGWHHLAFVFDGKQAHLYVDGVWVESKGYTPFSFNLDLTLGGGFPTAQPIPWMGYIDELKYYDGALSQYQVMNMTSGGLFGGGIAGYSSDDNYIANNTVQENSGHGIELRSSEDCNIYNNDIAENTCSGIELENSHFTNLEENRIRDQYGFEPLSEGLQLYYKFEEPDWPGLQYEIRDSSGNGNHATSYNGASQVTGKYGKGANFDGNDDYIILNKGNGITCEEQITYSAWIKWKEGDDVQQSIFQRYNALMYIDQATTELRMVLHTEGASYNPWVIGKMPVNEWIHVGFTYDGYDLNGYINGEKVKFEHGLAGRSRIQESSNPIYMGHNPSFMRAFQGVLDEMRIYNRALDEDEMSMLYYYGEGPALDIKYSNDGDYSDNRIENNKGPGIEMFGSESNRICFNDLANNGGDGISAIDCIDNDIYENFIEGSNASSPDLELGLASYYRFDEAAWTGAANEVKDSFGGAHCMAVGGVSTTPSEHIRAGDFDGFDDYVYRTALFSQNPTDAFSVALWMIPDSAPTNDAAPLVSVRDSMNMNEFTYSFELDPSQQLGYSYYAGTWRMLRSKSFLTMGQAYHVALTVDGADVRFYINGNLDAAHSGYGSHYRPTSTMPEISIGWGFDVLYNEYYDGLLDEVRIYDRAITPEEVLLCYKGPSQNGVVLRNAGDNRVWNNTIVDIKGDAVTLNNTDLNEIHNNDVSSCGGSAILLQSSGQNDIYENEIVSSNRHNTSLDQGLVGHWECEESSWNDQVGEVKDSSPSEAHGMTADYPSIVDGRIGTGGEFDDNYILVPDHSAHHMEEYLFTFSIWVRTTDANAIMMYKESSSLPDHIALSIQSSRAAFTFNVGAGYEANAVSSTKINDNNWHHIVGKRADLGTAEIYVDGVLEGCDSFIVGSAFSADPDEPIFIGSGDGNGYLAGRIDDVRIYNRSLNQREIQMLYYNDCQASILASYSTNNFLYDNVIRGGEYYAVSFANGSIGNKLDHNFFLENNRGLPQAYDESTANLWNDGVEGNYWSDWLTPDNSPSYGIVDLPYVLKGSGGNMDVLPICPALAPPLNATPYEDMFYQDGFSIVNAYLPSGVYTQSVIPNWVDYNDNGTFSGIPGNDDVGTWTVSVLTSDAYWSGELNFTLEVINVNDAPTITSSNVINAVEDSLYLINYTAEDIDPTNDTLTWNLVTDASFLAMTGNGTLSGVPGDADVGTSWLNISVSDGHGGEAYTNFTLVVKNINDAPIILTDNVLNATEDVLYEVNYTAFDEDITASILKWTVDTEADFLTMDVDTGLLSGTPDNDDVGEYPVNVTVTDGVGGSAYTVFNLTVHNVNDLPVWSNAPPNTTISLMEEYYYDSDAFDIDIGDVLTYSISSDPSSDIGINSSSGEIQWIPDTAGNYSIKLLVTDGSATIEHLYTINVLEDIANLPPKAELKSPEKGEEVKVLNPTLQWKVEDLNGDNVTSTVFLSKDLAMVNSLDASALIAEDLLKTQLTAPYTLEKGLKYYWTVIPHDGFQAGTCTSGIWNFTISAEAILNSPPEFLSNPPLEAGVGVEWTYMPIVSDADPDDVVTITFEEGPGGMSFTEGTLVWKPLSSQVGTHNVWISASDGKVVINQEFEVKVTTEGPSNYPPTISAIGDKLIFEGDTLEVQVHALDKDGDDLTYSVTSGPEGTSIDDTGKLTWVSGDAGEFNIAVSVSDGKMEASTLFKVVVLAKGGEDDDTDGDGLPDAWEIEHFQSLIYGPEDDPDNDNITNAQEMAGNTDPMVPDIDPAGDDDAQGSNYTIFIVLAVLLLIIIIIVILVIIIKRRKKAEEGSEDAGGTPEEEQEAVEETQADIGLHNMESPDAIEAEIASADVFIDKELGRRTTDDRPVQPKKTKKLTTISTWDVDDDDEEENVLKTTPVLDVGEGDLMDDPFRVEIAQGGAPAVLALPPAQIFDAQSSNFPIVNELFFISEDKEIVRHFTYQDTQLADENTLTNIIGTIQTFFADSFQMDSANLSDLVLGDFKIMIVGGKHLGVVAVCENKDVKELRKAVEQALKFVEEENAEVLENWQGDPGAVVGLDEAVNQMFSA